MSLHSNHLQKQAVSKKRSRQNVTTQDDETKKRKCEVETQQMKESMDRRLKKDAILRIIFPTEEGEKTGDYVKQLRNYCNSILKMYEHNYEQKDGLKIDEWVKDGIRCIINHPDISPKLGLIFFTLATEQWFADNFVPQPRIMYDNNGVPTQVPGGEPKVDASKFLKYMMNSLIPLTQQYLNGENDVNIGEYVRRAMLSWYTTGSSLSIEEQLKLITT